MRTVLPLTLLGWAITLGLGCSVVDPASLSSFECDDAGRCKVNGKPSEDAGPGTTIDGGRASIDAGTPNCSPATCSGCCDGENRCQTGNLKGLCGQAAVACTACLGATACNAGACVPLKANGSGCSSGDSCASGACVSGLCCSSRCAGACQSCSLAGTEGLCSLRNEGTGGCGAYACDGLNAECPGSCTSSLQCAPGRFCIGNACQVLEANAAPCTADNQCASGSCSDGVCCDQACTKSCDRCNLMGKAGVCTVSPASDPGDPACGGSVVCNGALTDCPILCTSGCPSGTYCSGTYCSAKKSTGSSCSSARECSLGFCASGKCCDAACTGACQSCSTAAGATADGVCTVLGPSRICRPAAATCDVAERCDGAQTSCPPDAVVDAGVTCATTDVGNWSVCNFPATCSRAGSRTRSTTSHTCAAGSCGANGSTETDTSACSRTTTGDVCGTTETSAWSACTYAAACSAAGSRSRTVTAYSCTSSGTCSSSVTSENDTAGCARNPEGAACGFVTLAAWSACTYSDTCTHAGSRSRAVMTPTCSSGTCSVVTTSETDTSGCTRNTNAASCGTAMTGAYGACTYTNSCSTGGSRSRQVTTYACSSGACGASTATETDLAGCGRATDGNSCGTTQTGAYGACAYQTSCTNSGSRARTVTTYTCGAGSCGSAAATETDTAGCVRDMSGAQCAASDYGAYSACSYASFCSSGGFRSRSVTLNLCGGGACGSTPAGSEVDTLGCGRVTENLECVTPTCGSYSSCNVTDCSQTRSCTHSVCVSDACTAKPYNQICDKSNGCCRNCIPR